MNNTSVLETKIHKTKLFVHDRNYSKWSFFDIDNNNEIDIELYPILKTINPIEQKCFNKDVFAINHYGSTTSVVYSSIKTNDIIAGVLILETNKTFGRTENGRLLYKCIPDDIHLPTFLIPFNVKIGFSKLQKNKYIVFKFDHWQHKHPWGVVVETLGDVDNLESFYEYQLYCKSLHVSITDFTNKTRAILKKNTQEQYIEQIRTNTAFKIEDYRDKYVFTIDPTNSVDFDDGFSVDEVSSTETVVTIYIANVFFWLETLGLWNSFSQRVATIYLPDRRRPMLPTILSDTLCSLQEKQQRFAFAMIIRIDNMTGKMIGAPDYKNVIIRVSKNYSYDDPQLLHNDVAYQKMFEVTAKCDKDVISSHDVVSYWMIQMNKMTAEYMLKNNIGIFRTTTSDATAAVAAHHDVHDIRHINEETRRVIQLWNNNMGKYVMIGENVSLDHFMMNTEYIHITSPIRRLVDLLNQMILFRHLSMVSVSSKESVDFMNHWTEKLEYINTTMRSIRKVQTDCFLLNRCFTDPRIMENEYRGILFDKMQKNDGTFHYMVYLEDLKLLSRIVSHLDLTNYSYYYFKLFLFETEDNTKKKIRLQIQEKRI